MLLVQHLDSVWNMPLAKVAETSVSPESGLVVVVVCNIHTQGVRFTDVLGDSDEFM